MGAATTLWDTAVGQAGRPASCPSARARERSGWKPGLPLYGNELDLQTKPLRRGLGRVVKLDKRETSSPAALARIAAEDPATARRARVRGRGSRAMITRSSGEIAERHGHLRDAVAHARRPDRDGVRRPSDAEPGR